MEPSDHLTKQLTVCRGVWRWGRELDCVFKDAVSVEEGGKDEGGETLPILKGGRPLATIKVFRTVSKMQGTSLF